VILDGEAVNACLVLVGQADGCEVLTIEGLMVEGTPHPLQTALSKPGGAVRFLHAGRDFGEQGAAPTAFRSHDDEIREARRANLAAARATPK